MGKAAAAIHFEPRSKNPPPEGADVGEGHQRRWS